MSGDTSGIGSRIVSGVAWKALSQVTLQLSRMAVALVLARLLTPHDWGLAAMVLLFSGIVVVFTDNALGTALIQRRELLPGDRSTVFWTSVVIGLALMLGGFALAGPLAQFYGEPVVRSLFAVTSIGFFVSALRMTSTALLVRDMQFRTLELCQIAATLLGAVTGITMAVADYGAWAIVGQQLAETTALTVLVLCLMRWRPSLTFSVATLRRLGRFAGNVFAENLFFQAGRNSSTLLIGRFLGASSAGVYALATNVILVPFSRIAAPLQQVFFPAFSQMSDDRPRVADVWIRATRLVGAISIPSLVGLMIVAPDMVQVVLGPKWSEATRVIQVLAWVGIIQSVQALSAEVLLALNRSGTLLRFTMLWFATTIVAFAVGVHWGIIGIAVSYAAATTLIEPLRTFLTTRALEISFWTFVRAFGGVAQATALMALAVAGTRMALIESGAPTAARLMALVVIGAVVYALGLLWRAPEIRDEGRSVMAGRRRRRAPRLESIEAGAFEQ
jgi:polysaccharide transporter, PST family